MGSAERGQRLKCGAREATRRRSDAGSASHRRVAPHAPFQAFSSSSAFDSTDSLSPSPGSPGPKEAGWGRPGELGRCSGPALGGSEAAGGSRTGDLGPPEPTLPASSPSSFSGVMLAAPTGGAPSAAGLWAIRSLPSSGGPRPCTLARAGRSSRRQGACTFWAMKPVLNSPHTRWSLPGVRCSWALISRSGPRKG